MLRTNLVSPISQMGMDWTVDGERSSWRKPTQVRSTQKF